MMPKENRYPIDYSAILYLAQMDRKHTNVYRFAVTLEETVDPALLQQAADRIYTRFPTIYAGFHSGIFSCTMVSADKAPVVSEDPGLLHTMLPDEMRNCAYRIFYAGTQIIIEAFHASTDGYGAMASLRALIAEYLHLRHGADSPERQEMLGSREPDWKEELRDAYLDYAEAKPAQLPGRYSYQLTAKDRDWSVKPSVEHFSTAGLLEKAGQFGVSPTSMLSAVMAEAIMELQERQGNGRKRRPVRIMVPVDLRRQFPSRTLRNFILYVLPTLEWENRNCSRKEKMQDFQNQMKQQMTREALAGRIAGNVRPQKMLLYRVTPLRLKCAVMRMVYRFLGESNSSITLTNLGAMTFSEALRPYVRHVDVLLTPRRKSPYNCGIISCGDTISISITRFGAEPELEPLFFEKLREILQ